MAFKFKIPLQSEVEAYITQKKGWPIEFVKYYADRFWNHYQASGWKLSSGNAIKDWKACFNSQWQYPKFKDDIEMLNKFTSKPVQGTAKAAGDLEAFYLSYCQRPHLFTLDMFGQWFSQMKAENLLKELSEDEKAILKEAYGNNAEKLRCAWVQKSLDYFMLTNYQFKKQNLLKAV